MPPHHIPEYGYIVGLIAVFIGAFLIAHLVARANGYQEK
jgi:hypothetical protein